MKAEYVAFCAIGIILGAAAYIAVGFAWLLNFAWQNALAG